MSRDPTGGDPTRPATSTPSHGGSTKRGFFLGLLFTIVAAALAIGFWITIVRYRDVSSRITCAANLQVIGQAIAQYAAENTGQIPPNLQTILDQQLIPPSAAQCPATDEIDCYWFVRPPPRLNLVVAADAPPIIVVIERPSNHRGYGVNALFLDGHVEWFSEPTASDVIAELLEGHNPPQLNNSR